MINYSSPNFELNTANKTKIIETLSSGWVSIGKNTLLLEEKVAQRYNVKHVIACANATTGLIIALKAAELINMKLLVPAFTWPSTIYAMLCNGNKPIYTDIKKDNWTINSSDQRETLPVDTFGASAGIFKATVYDAAHGWDIPNLGHRGLAEVISLSFTKVVTATEGGLILTNDDGIAETCKELRRLSGRIEEINAIIALNSIKYWDEEGKEYRQLLVNEYKEKFDFEFTTQKENYNNSVFSILLPTQAMRNKILKELSLHQIETKVYYEPVITGLPNTDDIYGRSISLPLGKHIDLEAINKITEIANNAVKGCPGKDYINKYLGRY
jgi:dTDP-4-amino-4,6-dideoxygalactose transaminase